MIELNKYLFLDSGLLLGYRGENAQIKVNKLIKDKAHNPLFGEEYFATPPKKWEVRFDNSYPNVIYDKSLGLYRCWYQTFIHDVSSEETPIAERGVKEYKVESSRMTALCYAESQDGIHWVKPNLGLVTFQGSKDNNIVLMHAHGAGIMLDEEELDPSKRYKLVTKIEYAPGLHYMAVGFSPDGIRFGKLHEWKKWNPAADSHNFPLKDPRTGKYAVITRTWANGVRLSAISYSDDFLDWSEPREILRGEGFYSQIYSMPVIPYAGIYLGFASMYHEGDSLDENFDTVDLELKFSANLDQWDSVAKDDYLIERGSGDYPLNADFDARCIFTAAPIQVEDKLWFYYMGGNGRHTGFRESALGRGYIKLDQFAYYTNKRPGLPGKLTTVHFHSFNDEVYLLAEIEAEGYIRVAVGPKYGDAYENFGFEDIELIPVEEGKYKLNFTKENLLALENKPLSFKFEFENARLFGLEGSIEHQRLKY